MDHILKGPKLDFIPTTTLGEFFFELAEKHKDRICQIDAKTDQKETYATVHQKSIRTALEMQKRGVNSSDVIVTCSVITLDTPIPILASFYLGAKVANLDPNLSVRQTAHLLSLVTPKMIFVEEESVGLIEKSLEEANLETEIVVFGKSAKYAVYSDFIEPQINESLFKPVKVDLHETGVMLFSSGTTGLAKAICHSHFSFLNIIHCFFKVHCNFDTVMSFTSFYWISGLMYLSCAFLAGGSRIIGGSTVKPNQALRCIEKYAITNMFLAPILTYELTNSEERDSYDTSSLSVLFVGGTAISPCQFRKVCKILKHTSVVFGYGLSEAGIVSSLHPIRDKELILKKVGSSGKPTPDVLMKIVDTSTNRSVGPNTRGEIRVKGPFLTTGYYKTPSDLFDEDGFLKTGDVGYFDEDHCLYVVGRMKEMFKYMSWHIVPSAIEDVLLEHPAVKEAAVFGLPENEVVGEVPAAGVVLKDGVRVSVKEIEDFVGGKVANYEKLRGGVYFLERLFRNPNGKLVRKEVRDYIIKSLDNK